MMWTDDPVRDWDRYCAEQESLPKCEKCEGPLGEYVYHIDDKELCEDCVTDLYQTSTDDFGQPLFCENCGKLLTDFMYCISDEMICEECVFSLYGETVKVDY